MVVPLHIARADWASVCAHYGHREVLFSGTFSNSVYTFTDNVYIRFTYVLRSPPIFTVALAPASHHVQASACVSHALSAAEADPGSTSNACSYTCTTFIITVVVLTAGVSNKNRISREIHGFYG